MLIYVCIYKERRAVKTQVAKWGNSMAVRIPKNAAEAAKLRPGDHLKLSVEGSLDSEDSQEKRNFKT